MVHVDSDGKEDVRGRALLKIWTREAILVHFRSLSVNFLSIQVYLWYLHPGFCNLF